MTAAQAWRLADKQVAREATVDSWPGRQQAPHRPYRARPLALSQPHGWDVT